MPASLDGAIDKIDVVTIQLESKFDPSVPLVVKSVRIGEPAGETEEFSLIRKRFQSVPAYPQRKAGAVVEPDPSGVLRSAILPSARWRSLGLLLGFGISVFCGADQLSPPSALSLL